MLVRKSSLGSFISVFVVLLMGFMTFSTSAMAATWSDKFTSTVVNGTVSAIACDTYGNMYIGGFFSFYDKNNSAVNNVARWNGTSWSALGTGMIDGVSALAVAPDGTLYAGGYFTTAGGISANYIAKWNGSSWSALGAGMGGSVNALAVAPDGTLYAGSFMRGIARWDGSSWSALGAGFGMSDMVNAVAVAPDGTLYVGGRFTAAGGISANNIAKWDGSRWSALGVGMNSSGQVSALVVAPDGTLYAGGSFSTAGGISANNIARWDGSSWSALGAGMSCGVVVLAVAPDGALYAAGGLCPTPPPPPPTFPMPMAGGISTNIAKWNGSSWSALGAGMGGSVNALAVAPNGTLYAGGQFTTAGGISVSYIAKWNGSFWSALGLEIGKGLSSAINALAIAPDGTLYAGGNFSTAGGISVNSIARWNGSSWFALGAGMNGSVSALAVAPDGTLYAGGSFSTAGGISANSIARWNGSSWFALGAGMNGSVSALAVAPDGTLYAGGSFSTAGGISANSIARWDGSSWSALGAGMSGGFIGGGFMRGEVTALAVAPDGTLYAGGNFSTAGGISTNNIARWDGSSWSALGAGMSGGWMGKVTALAVAPDGTLYAGGSFTTAGGISANSIAGWDGSSWSALGAGLSGGGCSFGPPAVNGLAVTPDGTLYVGGSFSTAGGISANNIARWDGSSWSSLGLGVNNSTSALAANHQNNVFAGGYFTQAGGKISSHIGYWFNSSPLVKSFTSNITSGYVPLKVNLTCEASDDGSIVEYQWDTNGDKKADFNTTIDDLPVTYTRAGIRNTSVTVKDDEGATTTSRIVKIVVISGTDFFDLSGQWISLISTNQGKQISGQVEIKNAGTKNTGTFSVELYLSKDGQTWALKPFKKFTLVNGVRAGLTGSISFTHKAATSLIGKYIVAVVDSDYQVDELKENNNRAVMQIK